MRVVAQIDRADQSGELGRVLLVERLSSIPSGNRVMTTGRFRYGRIHREIDLWKPMRSFVYFSAGQKTLLGFEMLMASAAASGRCLRYRHSAPAAGAAVLSLGSVTRGGGRLQSQP